MRRPGRPGHDDDLQEQEFRVSGTRFRQEIDRLAKWIAELASADAHSPPAPSVANVVVDASAPYFSLRSRLHGPRSTDVWWVDLGRVKGLPARSEATSYAAWMTELLGHGLLDDLLEMPGGQPTLWNLLQRDVHDALKGLLEELRFTFEPGSHDRDFTDACDDLLPLHWQTFQGWDDGWSVQQVIVCSNRPTWSERRRDHVRPTVRVVISADSRPLGFGQDPSDMKVVSAIGNDRVPVTPPADGTGSLWAVTSRLMRAHDGQNLCQETDASFKTVGGNPALPEGVERPLSFTMVLPDEPPWVR